MNRIRVRSRSGATLAAGAIVLLVALTGCGGGGSDDAGSSSTPGVTASSITLGGTTPLSGPLGAGCHRIDGATAAWLKYVNAKGGVNGRTIQWEPMDDAYDPARAAANARTLVAGDNFAIFGGCGSLQPPAIMPIAQAAEVPYLFPIAPIPDIYTPTKPGIFAARPSYGDAFVALLPEAFSTYGPGNVSSMLIQAPGMDAATAQMKTLVEDAGKQFTDNGLITAGTADFTPYVLKLKEQAPDYVVTNLTTGDAAKFLATAAEAGFSPGKMYLNTSSMADVSVTGQFQNGAQNSLANKLLVTSEVVPASDPASADCIAAIKEYAPDLSPDTTSLTGCLVGEYLTSAIEKTPEPFTRDSFIKTLESLDKVPLAPNAAPVSMSSTNHLATTALNILQLGNDGAFAKVGEVTVGAS